MSKTYDVTLTREELVLLKVALISYEEDSDTSLGGLVAARNLFRKLPNPWHPYAPGLEKD